VHILWADLKPSWYPDAENTDVHQSDEDADTEFQLTGAGWVVDNQGNSVDDDLDDALDL
jgi:hypothetical protein